MMIAVEAPVELYDGTVPVAPVSTPDGQLLERVDGLPAGAWLAVTVEGIDVSRLSPWDLPAYLSAAHRVQCWAASLVDDAVAELAARSRVSELGAAADAEVALALSEPLAVAQKRIARARRLRAGLPLFKRAFARGDLSDYAVDQLVHATAGCNDPDVLTRVQEQTLARRAGKTAKELRRYATRVLTRLDPAVAQKRARQARDDADVTVQPLDDGMARVVVDAPVEDAQIVKAYTDAYAARAKNTGDPRRTGVLRVEGISRLCADALMHERSTTGGRPVEIGIVIGVDTALGLNQLPAEVPAQGIVPRDVVAAMIATELPKLRLLVTDDSGHLAYRGTSSYRPTADQVAHVRARWVTSLGPGSQVPARRSDVDHLQEWPDGRTIVTNLAPFDRSWHNHKTRRSLHVTVDDSGSVIVTTVLGQSRTVTPYQYDAVTQTGQPTPF